ncbi:hypothetical protein [Anaeromicropila herbilytica]|uniref:Uncharacterized protein n=1 Tax=Anaeromicropila herbilytica TaxID=2785025 RepID=A0A7R7EK84_9FIRM|nr:hypothetical protein [Anaeromicropila herbilytica]BCN30655.1 hypothetical protein bsdtb5_19500 [Anaeromicropila herbilytica]
MSIVNETIVLDFYLKEIDEDNISFLKGKDYFKSNVKESIINLRSAQNLSEKIEISKALWKLLFESAMSYIDPDKRGYDELFHYFDEYVEFEELIFASDSFYRDHTFHCLWVYFLGEYVMKSKEYGFLFKNVYKNENMFKSILEVFKKTGINEKVEKLDYALREILKTELYQDSIYCISALTHDLGYPLKKINKINKSIRTILPYFSINNFNEFNFQYDNIQKSNIDSFIEILTDDITVNARSKDNSNDFGEIMSKVLKLENDNLIGINEEGIKNLNKDEISKLENSSEVIVKLKKSRSKYISYCNDFEEYQHGIMSAFLLTRVLKAFTNSRFTYGNKSDIDIYDIDFADASAKMKILTSITSHTNSNYRIDDLANNEAILTFIDELEEFSRISRANQNRQYVAEFCRTDLSEEDGVFNIDFIFDNEELDNLDPERAFKGRCKRFLTLFHITELSENLKLRLRCIGKLSYDSNVYTLEIARKFAKITINGEEKNIPQYLKGRQFYSRDEYANL